MWLSGICEIGKLADLLNVHRCRLPGHLAPAGLEPNALVVKVRVDGRTQNVAVMLATAINAEGQREILGLDIDTAESGAGWLTFLRGLVPP